jgi:hypothetical protein
MEFQSRIKAFLSFIWLILKDIRRMKRKKCQGPDRSQIDPIVVLTTRRGKKRKRLTVMNSHPDANLTLFCLIGPRRQTNSNSRARLKTKTNSNKN